MSDFLAYLFVHLSVCRLSSIKNTLKCLIVNAHRGDASSLESCCDKEVHGSGAGWFFSSIQNCKEEESDALSHDNWRADCRSNEHDAVWYWLIGSTQHIDVSTVFIFVSLKTEIAKSVNGQKLQGHHAEDAIVEPYFEPLILVI